MAKCTVHRPRVSVTLNMTEEEAGDVLFLLKDITAGPAFDVALTLRSALDA